MNLWSWQSIQNEDEVWDWDLMPKDISFLSVHVIYCDWFIGLRIKDGLHLLICDSDRKHFGMQGRSAKNTILYIIDEKITN